MMGDPVPVVTWQRENGNLPDGRSRILLDNTLRIENSRPEDQGKLNKSIVDYNSLFISMVLFSFKSSRNIFFKGNTFVKATMKVEMYQLP